MHNKAGERVKVWIRSGSSIAADRGALKPEKKKPKQNVSVRR